VLERKSIWTPIPFEGHVTWSSWVINTSAADDSTYSDYFLQNVLIISTFVLLPEVIQTYRFQESSLDNTKREALWGHSISCCCLLICCLFFQLAFCHCTVNELIPNLLETEKNKRNQNCSSMVQTAPSRWHAAGFWPSLLWLGEMFLLKKLDFVNSAQGCLKDCSKM